MSELKAITIYDAYWKAASNGDNSIPVYLKSEADKVIAELKDKVLQYKVLYKEKCRDINSQEQHFAKQLYHHKFKRCLAMARMCEERYNYLTCLENWQMTDKEYQQAIGDYWDRWHNRWLELADKFKDKEAK